VACSNGRPAKVIEDILKSTLEKIPAKFILLVDSSGQLVNVVGDTVILKRLHWIIDCSGYCSQPGITRLIGKSRSFRCVKGRRALSLIIEEASHTMSFITLFHVMFPSDGRVIDPNMC